MSNPLTHRSSAESDEEALPIGAAPPQYPAAPPPPYPHQAESSGDEAAATPANAGPSQRGRLGSFAGGALHAVNRQLDNLDIADALSTSSDDDSGMSDVTSLEEGLLSVLENPVAQFNIYPQFAPPTIGFVPAVGDIDAFVKVPRPDEIEDNAGVTELDEPAPKQSDPVVVDMKMRDATKAVTTQENAPVKKLGRDETTKDQLDEWMRDMKVIRKNKAPPTVTLKPGMPDIETLMQEIHPLLEKKLENKEIKLPTADLDVDLRTFAEMVCGILDIPIIDGQIIPALHQVFAVYIQFSNSQHFKNLEHNRAQSSQQPDEAERLEL